MNMYNCKDVTVSSSTFENNHAQSVFRDLPNRVSGGGLSITLYGSLNHHLGKQGAFLHIIQSCTFSNNSANSIVAAADTTSILNGGYVNDRGGGLAIYSMHSSLIRINILGCNFSHNSALVGGGMHLFSPALVSEERFSVIDSYFEGNEAKSGGGINLGASYLADMAEDTIQSLMQTVIVTKNIFLKNRARFGGAIRLRPGTCYVFYVMYLKAIRV